MLSTLIGALRPAWRLLEAADAEQALAVAAAEAPHYATLDYNMPGMNGMELGQRLLQSLPAMRMVLLTANIQEPIRQRAAALGIDFVAKPINEKSVTQIVELLGD